MVAETAKKKFTEERFECLKFTDLKQSNKFWNA